MNSQASGQRRGQQQHPLGGSDQVSLTGRCPAPATGKRAPTPDPPEAEAGSLRTGPRPVCRMEQNRRRSGGELQRGSCWPGPGPSEHPAWTQSRQLATRPGSQGPGDLRARRSVRSPDTEGPRPHGDRQGFVLQGLRVTGPGTAGACESRRGEEQAAFACRPLPRGPAATSARHHGHSRS